MSHDLTAMRIFIAVGDAGSFSRAAEGLGLSASVVSHHVAKLERVLHSGAPLAIDGMFVVRNNPVLEDLSGFQSITSVSGMFQIENNTLIEACDIQDLIDAIGTDNIGGDLVVDGGC